MVNKTFYKKGIKMEKEARVNLRILFLVIIGCVIFNCSPNFVYGEDANAVKPVKPKMRYDVWVEDCLEKVWQEKAMPENAVKEISIHTARGEYEAIQVAVSPKDDSIGAMRATCSELKKKDSGKTLPAAKVRYVDYVPVGKNSWNTPPEQLIVKAPAWVPDVLYDVEHAPVWQNRTRPIWLTFNIPSDAEAGTYTGEVTVFANEEQIKVPLTVQVHNVTVPAKRNLITTNWLNLDSMARWHGCTFFDERFWAFANIYAENMASHRQNMILTPLYMFYTGDEQIGIRLAELLGQSMNVKKLGTQLVGISADGDKLRFDFTNFDKWVNIFKKAGVPYIEGSHLGWIDATVFCYIIRDGKLVQANFRSDAPEAEQFLSQFLPALQSHLIEKGWVDDYYQHLRDEPNDGHKIYYNKIAGLVHKYAPKIKTIDAVGSSDIEPPTVVVPLLSEFGIKYDYYKKLQDKGQEVWFYTACGPNGAYANRFLDIPQLKIRYLHWLNFKYNARGFLHWGYNWWGKLSPLSDIYMTWAVGPLPPGDSYVVYPTPHGLLDSIRWDTERDGIEDYELLKMLQAKDQKKADEICSSMVQGFVKYDVDINHFRAARLKLLESLEK